MNPPPITPRTIFIVNDNYEFTQHQQTSATIIKYSEYAETEPDDEYQETATNKGLLSRQMNAPNYIRYLSWVAINSSTDIYFVVNYKKEWNAHQNFQARLAVDAYENLDYDFVDTDDDRDEIPKNINADINSLHVCLKDYKRVIKINAELYKSY